MPDLLPDDIEIEAVHLAAFLVQQHRKTLARLAVQSHRDGRTPITQECPIACLGLSRHASNPLTRAPDGPNTVGNIVDLARRGELAYIPGLGRRRVGEILTSLVAAGFTLDHDHDHGHRPAEP